MPENDSLRKLAEQLWDASFHCSSRANAVTKMVPILEAADDDIFDVIFAQLEKSTHELLDKYGLPKNGKGLPDIYDGLHARLERHFASHLQPQAPKPKLSWIEEEELERKVILVGNSENNRQYDAALRALKDYIRKQVKSEPQAGSERCTRCNYPKSQHFLGGISCPVQHHGDGIHSFTNDPNAPKTYTEQNMRESASKPEGKENV